MMLIAGNVHVDVFIYYVSSHDITIHTTRMFYIYNQTSIGAHPVTLSRILIKHKLVQGP